MWYVSISVSVFSQRKRLRSCPDTRSVTPTRVHKVKWWGKGHTPSNFKRRWNVNPPVTDRNLLFYTLLHHTQKRSVFVNHRSRCDFTMKNGSTPLVSPCPLYPGISRNQGLSDSIRLGSCVPYITLTLYLDTPIFSDVAPQNNSDVALGRVGLTIVNRSGLYPLNFLLDSSTNKL